jgi:hypothetical protein
MVLKTKNCEHPGERMFLRLLVPIRLHVFAPTQSCFLLLQSQGLALISMILLNPLILLQECMIYIIFSH